MVYVCTEQSDLYQVLTAAGVAGSRCDSLAEALAAAAPGETVLALAAEYPKAALEVTAKDLELARDKLLRLYLEYPAAAPGLTLGPPTPTEWERVAVASDFFGAELPHLSVLALHGCWYLPTTAPSPHLAVARVAGYRNAVYGFPEQAWPVLFELPGHSVLVATSCLSQFVTGRYGPTVAWEVIWRAIL